MSLHIWARIGGTLFLIGVIGIIILSVKPLINAFHIWAFNRQDIQECETERNKAATKMLRKVAAGVIVVGMILFIPSMIILYAPRGFDSLLSKNAEGVYTGDDDKKLKHEGGRDSETSISEKNQDDDTIRVEGKIIHFNGDFSEDIEEFEKYLDGVSEGEKIRLKDDFAIAATFHQVENLMKEKGVAYSLYNEAEGADE